MKKAAFIFGLPTLALIVFAAVFAATAKEAPEIATLDQCMKKQPAVTFTHKAHTELTECTTCHHTQEGLTADSDMEVTRCVDCHLEPAEASTPACTELSLKKNPYHVVCVSCHKESAKDTAPTKCKGCHVKE